MKQFLAVILIAIMASSAVLAQNESDDQGNANDPNVNIRANACYKSLQIPYGLAPLQLDDMFFEGV